MRAKRLGRSEGLSWINLITQSDYPKIEFLSDGVGYCQIFDAFYDNGTGQMMKIKLNSTEKEDWQKNFCIGNEMLSKAKSYKQVDPRKLSVKNFSNNFELLQYIYDFIYKSFNSSQPKTYKGLKRRCDVVKTQYGKKAGNDIKKYLPSHLLTNDVLLQLDKEKYFTDATNRLNNSKRNIVENEDSINRESNASNDEGFYSKLDKYKSFFKGGEDDLNKYIESNKNGENEIKDIEEEKQYYLDKIATVKELCEKKKDRIKNKDCVTLCEDIIERITSVPDDFK